MARKRRILARSFTQLGLADRAALLLSKNLPLGTTSIIGLLNKPPPPLPSIAYRTLLACEPASV